MALQPISVQYLDEIESGGVAEAAGLVRGDFLLNVNGVDVRAAAHEQVVQLIRQSGDKVTMTVASPVYLQLNEEETAREREARAKRKAIKAQAKASKLTTSVTVSDVDGTAASGDSQPPAIVNGSEIEPQPLPQPSDSELVNGNVSASEDNGSTSATDASSDHGRSKAPPPAPPKRDPSTTLTVGRTRARSLCIPGGASDTASTDSGTVQAIISSGNTSDASSNQGHTGSRHDKYDSEGRSTKSSSPTTSIESMVAMNGGHQTVGNGNSDKSGVANNKIASIRSRGRRMSAFELEEFFARQDENGANGRPRSSKDSGSRPGASTTLKKKSKKKSSLTKSFHSTPDIQAELEAQLGDKSLKIKGMTTSSGNGGKKPKLNGHLPTNKSNSQEDLRQGGQLVYAAAETLTLKNGKIVTEELRLAPPSQPPPPLPSSTSSKVLPATVAAVKASIATNDQLVVKMSDVHKNGPLSKSDYANYAQLAAAQAAAAANKMTSSTLSSFRPANENTSSSTATMTSSVTVTSSKTTSSNESVKTSTNVRSVRGSLKSSGATSSVYTRQATVESLDGDDSSAGAKPFIPEPDYTSSEDETEASGLETLPPSRDMSTFKSLPAPLPAPVSSSVTVPSASEAKNNQDKVRSRWSTVSTRYNVIFFMI